VVNQFGLSAWYRARAEECQIRAETDPTPMLGVCMNNLRRMAALSRASRKRMFARIVSTRLGQSEINKRAARHIPQCSSLALMLPLDVEPIVCAARKMVQWPPRRQPQPTEEVTLIARAMRWLEPQALERRRPDRYAMLRCERQP